MGVGTMVAKVGDKLFTRRFSSGTGGPIRAFDDLHVQMRANFGQRGAEFRSLIATVGEQLLKKGKHPEQGRHDENGSISILDVGRMDNSVKQQA